MSQVRFSTPTELNIGANWFPGLKTRIYAVLVSHTGILSYTYNG
jgi:hypothetical protein